MRFAEKLLLLLHSEESDHFVPIPEWKMPSALANAVLMDLAMEGRVDSDLISTSPRTCWLESGYPLNEI